MQATQSRKASGSWCRDGQFAALRYVSRHLNIAGRLDGDDFVERERGIRRGLLPGVWRLSPPGDDDAAEDTQAPGEGRVDPGDLDDPQCSGGELGYAAREMLRRIAERACDPGANRARQHAGTIEEEATGWIKC
jgi:hypothetical protein